MTTITLDQIDMLGIALIVLFCGMFLTMRIAFLRENFIPAAVSGGISAAALIWLLRDGFGIALEFDMSPRDLLLLVFFSTVGLSVKFSTLLSGGKTLPLLVVAAGIFLVLQNLVGVAIAKVLGAEPVYGLMAGSISFAGGHGTAIAWGSEFEASGIAGASTVGLAFATFGLVAGGLVGGPIASRLIKRHGIDTGYQNSQDGSLPLQQTRSEATENEPFGKQQWLFNVLVALFVLVICVSLGELVNQFISGRGIKLPGFLTAMFVGILLNNTTTVISRPGTAETIDQFGTVSLHLFLAMSMMTVELWTLGGAFKAIVLLLLAQVLLMTIFAMFVIFYITGRDYDAVVIAAGFSGLGLGATPVAIANMTSVTATYGPSQKAMLLVPLVGAFFIDLLNAGTIQYFLTVL